MSDSNIPSPDQANYSNSILDFINQAVNESESFLRAQPGYNKISRSIDSILGDKSNPLAVGSLSDISANHIGKAATQLVAGMTDTRPFWEYRTFNPNFKKQVQIFGKIALHLWLQRQWDMQWGDMIRHCCTSGSSYANLTWDSRIMDLDVHAEDPRDVLPFRPGNYYSIQSCEGVIIRRERTVNYLRQRYPDKADFIQPDKDGSSTRPSGTRYERLMTALGSPFREVLFPNRQSAQDIPRIPTATEFTCYLDDTHIHHSKSPLYMGDWHLSPTPDCTQCLTSGTPHSLNNWSYKVQKGERIYPNKRLIICTTSTILYDNTSPYWHGLYPCPKLTLDPWPSTYLGKGLIWDCLPMQKFLNRLIQVLDNHFQKWQQPDLFADKNSVAESDFKKINTARPGLKVRQNPMAGKGIALQYPDQLPAYFFETLKWCIDEIGTLSGAKDISGIMQLNQLPSADAVDKIMEAMTPEVRLRSRILEAFTREFGLITAYNIAQFKTIAERLTILGPDGVALEDFDYDPGSLIPDFVHAEDHDSEGKPTAIALARGPQPRYNRAKEFMRQTTMHIAPGSLLSASEIENKLIYLQGYREGFIDPETLADRLGIANWGSIPGDTIFEKLMFMAQSGLGPGAQQGRPPSGQSMPRIKVSESG